MNSLIFPLLSTYVHKNKSWKQGSLNLYLVKKYIGVIKFAFHETIKRNKERYEGIKIVPCDVEGQLL
jgi:hypothetical protein